MEKEIEQQFNKLTKIIQDGFENSEKKTDEKIENLAIMINKGFEEVDGRFNKVDERFNKVENRLEILEHGQEDIKIKLDNVAYRFELKEL